MSNSKPVVIIGGIALLLWLLSKKASGAVPGGTGGYGGFFDFSGLADQYGQDNVNRLTQLAGILAVATDPNTGQPLSQFQQQVMLSQALFESGLFTDVANLNNVDSFHNWTGIKGNSQYPAAPGSMYVDYPDLPSYVDDWMRVLSLELNGPAALEATSVTDFVNRLKTNDYFEDNLDTYLNGINTYYNLLSGTTI